jgi:dienelactone hydrolase
MFESRNRLLAAVLAVALTGSGLGGCEATKDGDPFPPPPTEVFKAEFRFNPTGTTLPFLPAPTDIFFSGSTDGTLNVPAALAPLYPLGAALSALDGWSTTAPIATSFSMPLDVSTLSGTTVHLIEMYLSNTTKAPAQGAELPAGVTSPVRRVLVADTDFTVGISDAIDSGGRYLKITPLKPLTPSSGATNIGYIVLLTDGIRSTTGQTAAADDQYASYRDAPADCSSFASGTTDNALCRLTKAHLAIGQAVGVTPASVVLSWSFTTQSVNDTLAALAATTPAQPVTVVPTGLTTKQANAALQGKANIYVGATTTPYYLTPAANPTDRASVLTKFWTAAGASPVPGLDPTSRHVTRFNPLPFKVADPRIPVLVTVPNATAAGGACTKPAAGWPVVIIQHGITGNRTQALAMADSYADACFVVAAIDLPLHGIKPDYNEDGNGVDNTSPLYCSSTTPNPACMGAIERTFDVDLVNNASTSSAVSDGKVDPSGTHFINLTSPLTSRDNNRQAAADLNVFSKTIKTLDLTADGISDIDPNRVHLTGLSLGAMVGTVASKFTDFVTVTASAPGGLVTRLLLDSPTFGPTIRAGLSASLVPDSYLYNSFVRDLQAVIDAADPVNHVFGAQANNPYHLEEITGDSVVPNSATDRLILAGELRKLTTLGPNPVPAGDGAYTLFTAGSHGTLFDPTASGAATVEAQKEAVLFAASALQPGGPFVVLSDATVLSLQ